MGWTFALLSDKSSSLVQNIIFDKVLSYPCKADTQTPLNFSSSKPCSKP